MKILFKFWIILGMFIPTLGITSERPSELQCLTATVFFEARAESTRGQKAVADVVLNRTKHSAFKGQDTVCKVVLAPAQFSWVKGNKKQAGKLLNGDTQGLKDKELSAYQKAQSLAVEALSEKYTPVLPSNVISFHNTTVQPVWTKTMKRHGKIGNHYFYSFKRKGSK